MQRAERLLAITLLLQARGKMTAQHLAELLGISVRTIYRDIDALSLAHIPISMDHGPGGGYYLLNEHSIEAALFTREEAISLVLGSAMIGTYSLFADDDDMHRALLKLEAILPEEYRPDVRAAQERILFDTQAWYVRPSMAYLDMIRSALAKGQQLDILYPDDNDINVTWWRVEPYGLVYKGLSRRQVRTGIWYLVAFCHTKRAMQTYRVGRIQDVRACPEPVEERPDFDLHAYWQEARLHQQQAHTVMLKLLVKAAFRHRLRDDITILSEERDGSIIVHVPMESLDDAVAYALTLGANAIVLGPTRVREMVAQTAKKMLALYRK